MGHNPCTQSKIADMPDSAVKPVISAVIAVRNEAEHIEACLKSIFEQEVNDFELEILVVDGDSSDGTRQIVERLIFGRPNAKLLQNSRRKTPFAFNLGIQHARGEYVCILGAHSVYARNYISTCFQELQAHGAAGCSGCLITRPANGTLEAKLIAWALSHWFGTSSRSTRTHPAGFADTISYPVFLKRALVEVGGYEAKLHRNQDNDLSQKLRARGYKLYLTDATTCEYFPSPNLLALIRYSFKTGYWNRISLKENAQSMALRHFVPFAFVLALLGSLTCLLASWLMDGMARITLQAPFVLVCTSYFLAAVFSSFQVAIRERSAIAMCLLPVFFALHTSYGLGTCWGFLTDARLPSIAGEQESIQASLANSKDLSGS